MEPLVIGGLAFMTVLASVLALLGRVPEREVVATRLEEIERLRAPRAMTLAQPFYRRAFFPLLKSIPGVLARFVPPKSIAAVRSNLEKAGRRTSDPTGWIVLKWFRTFVLGFAIYGAGVLLRWPPIVRVYLVLALAGFVYVSSELSIRRAIARRQALILKELPETLDLLTITVEAGLGLDQALETVSARRPGPLAQEIRFYLDEVRLGRDRHEALRAIGSRTGVEELVSFTGTLVQAMEFGVSIAVVLRVQADEVRTRRKQRIEEKAMKAPVKLLFPMVFLILPSIFVVTAGPGFIRAYFEFIKPVGPGLFAPPPQPGR